MAEADAARIIALEEHYVDRELGKSLNPTPGLSADTLKRLLDIDDLRLAEMDAAGIDMQILSHGNPSGQVLKAEDAVVIARGVNDRLAEAIKPYPTRFAGFAMLPTAVPDKAADELQRTVEELGFVGALTNGQQDRTAFLDDKRFWPIFERAAKLDVPIYMHPGLPNRTVIETYYQDYQQDYRQIASAAWGFGVEAGTQALRMVLSGVFDAYPTLKIILGHLGEMLPFHLWRTDYILSRPGQKEIDFRKIFSEHFYVTTSGFFSDTALDCVTKELGVERVMFAVDYPQVASAEGTSWAKALPIPDQDKAKILSGNAMKLLRLDRW